VQKDELNVLDTWSVVHGNDRCASGDELALTYNFSANEFRKLTPKTLEPGFPLGKHGQNPEGTGRVL